MCRSQNAVLVVPAAKAMTCSLRPGAADPCSAGPCRSGCMTAAAALLAANVFFIVGLLSLSGARGMELALHKAQLQSLAQRHQALLEAAAEQEAQLVALALEAERLAQRVQELESLGEEIWRLLGIRRPARRRLHGGFGPGRSRRRL